MDWIVTLIHVVAGSIALLSGAGALIARKGGRRHGRIGTWFFGSMLVMGGTGAVIAALNSERMTSVIGVFTCYLVATAWVTARKREGRAGTFEMVAMLVALGCSATNFMFGMMALVAPNGRLDSLPPQPAFGFAVLALLAASGDLNFLLRGQISGKQRVTRHLWRMCVALLIAAMSFFLGQQDEFPREWRGHFLWFVPVIAVFAALIFWWIRARFTGAFKWVAPRPA